MPVTSLNTFENNFTTHSDIFRKYVNCNVEHNNPKQREPEVTQGCSLPFPQVPVRSHSSLGTTEPRHSVAVSSASLAYTGFSKQQLPPANKLLGLLWAQVSFFPNFSLGFQLNTLKSHNA